MSLAADPHFAPKICCQFPQKTWKLENLEDGKAQNWSCFMVPETPKEGKALRPIRSSQKYMTEEKRFTSLRCGAYTLQDLCHQLHVSRTKSWRLFFKFWLLGVGNAFSNLKLHETSGLRHQQPTPGQTPRATGVWPFVWQWPWKALHAKYQGAIGPVLSWSYETAVEIPQLSDNSSEGRTATRLLSVHNKVFFFFHPILFLA